MSKYNLVDPDPYDYGSNENNNPNSSSPADPYSYVTDYRVEEPKGFDLASSREEADVSVNSVVTTAFMYMFLGLLVTGITALLVMDTNVLYNMMYSGSMAPFYICFILEFVIVIAGNHAMQSNNVVLSYITYFGYAIINGLTLSVIFLVYTASSIANVFFLTAGLFGIMAAVGYFTKKDLTGIGNLCFFALIGIILAGIVNLFIGSSRLELFISCIGVLIFIGITAYDTQKLKQVAYENNGYNLQVLGLWGAMNLYLDFINLFLKLLRLLGRRRN